MRDEQTNEQQKIELLSQWKLEAEFRKICTQESLHNVSVLADGSLKASWFPKHKYL